MTKKQREVVQTFANTYNLSDRYWREQVRKLWAGEAQPILPFDRDMLALKGKITDSDLRTVKCEQNFH